MKRAPVRVIKFSPADKRRRYREVLGLPALSEADLLAGELKDLTFDGTAATKPAKISARWLADFGLPADGSDRAKVLTHVLAHLINVTTAKGPSLTRILSNAHDLAASYRTAWRNAGVEAKRRIHAERMATRRAIVARQKDKERREDEAARAFREAPALAPGQSVADYVRERVWGQRPEGACV